MNADIAPPQRRQSTRHSQTSRRIHWLRTLQAKRHHPFAREHLRFRPQPADAPALHCLLVDCSHSMLGGQRLALAKGVLLQLIQMSYAQRAEVAIVGFAGNSAKVHLPPTLARPMTSRQVEKWLHPIRGGGATPFAEGVRTAAGLLTRTAREQPQRARWLWLLTDGRTLESPDRPAHVNTAVIIDCERHRVPLGACRRLAERWQAHYRLLTDFACSASPEALT